MKHSSARKGITPLFFVCLLSVLPRTVKRKTAVDWVNTRASMFPSPPLPNLSLLFFLMLV